MPFEVGSVVEGKVTGITKFGAFIQLQDGTMGLVHISEIADSYVTDINEHLKENQIVKVKIISIDVKGKLSLSIKKAIDSSNKNKSFGPPPDDFDWSSSNKSDNLSFEERLSKFKKDSEEKMSDLKRSFESKRGSGGYRKSIPF
ncbi:MAG: S1 RNA-binding domain-containing protein [Ignavibacteriales bacterium]